MYVSTLPGPCYTLPRQLPTFSHCSTYFPSYITTSLVFQSAAIQDIIKEIDEGFAATNAFFDENKENVRLPEVSSSLVFRIGTINRNKRCVLSYLYNRFNRAKALWWEAGRAIPTETKSSLSPAELVAFDKYDAIVSKYMKNVGVSLIADQQPPRELLVEVMVKEDCGEIMTETGPVRLAKDTRHLMRRSDCELLIRQGFLEQVTHTNT